MADNITRKKKIPSLEALDISDIRTRKRKKIPNLEAIDIDISDIHIRGTRNYGNGLSWTRKSIVIGDEVKIGDLPVRKPRDKLGLKPGCIRRKTEPVRTMQAKPKPPPRPKVRKVRDKVVKVRVTPPKLEKTVREAKVYKPSQEEIRRVTNVMKELEKSRVKAILDTDTRDEEY